MLTASDHIISFATEIQQGGALGPLLFTMAVVEVASSIASSFNIWYFDDETLDGRISAISGELFLLQLEVNTSKWEIIHYNYSADDFEGAILDIILILEDIKIS